MLSTGEYRYVWAIEWRLLFPIEGEPSTLYDFYGLEPRAGVSEEDWEKFMTDEMFPAVGSISLRGSSAVKHYLLKQDVAVEQSLNSILAIHVRDESIQAKLESLTESAGGQSFALVGSWEIE